MKRIFLLGLYLIVILTFLSGYASAEPRLYFNPPLVESNPGDVPALDLLMDGCNAGISGYAILVSLDNSTVASFNEITTPPWADLNKIIKINSTAVLVQGADTERKMEPGGVPTEQLARVTINAISAGYATVNVKPIIIDDEHGGRYNPVSSSASIVISGAGPIPKKPLPKNS